MMTQEEFIQLHEDYKRLKRQHKSTKDHEAKARQKTLAQLRRDVSGPCKLAVIKIKEWMK